MLRFLHNAITYGEISGRIGNEKPLSPIKSCEGPNQMRSLSREDIDLILEQGKLLSDREITIILDEFQKEHPEIYELIYGEPSDDIAENNREMANLFLELCFDVIWVYRYGVRKAAKNLWRTKMGVRFLDPT